MKAAHENNISLVDAEYAGVYDSAKLDRKWLNRLKGEPCHGSCPSCLELEDRSELRQIDRVNRFVEKNSRFDDMETEKEPKENRKRSINQSHCLPKVRKTCQRSLNSGYIQKLMKKTTKMNCSTKVFQYQRYLSKISFVVQSKDINYTEDIATSFACTCSNFKTAANKMFSQLVWLLIYVFKI